MKNIGILTSGGDAPGMNAVIRAVTRKAIHEGFGVYGIHRGYEGLLKNEIELLTRRDVGGIVNKGGTTLKTARCLEFKEAASQKLAYHILKAHNIDALIVVGGDGSMAGARALSALGMPTITIPGTIDNDMCGTEYTIGFDTALNTVLEAVNKIRDTTIAHERVAIIEVMGRHSGHIAVQAGLACGAEVVLVPEAPMPLDEMCSSLKATHLSGKTYSIVIVAEGVCSGYEVCDYIRQHTEFKPSVTVLGYLQRGGSPSARDSIMAALMGEKAVEALVNGQVNALIGYINSKVAIVPYDEAVNLKFGLDENAYKLINVLGR